MNKEILFILDNYYPKLGGAELVYQRLAEGLVKRGYQIRVVTTSGKGLAKREMIGGVEIIRLCQNRYLFLFWALFYLLRSIQDATIVHTATYSAAIPAWLYARIKKKKVTLTVHEVLDRIWFRGMNIVPASLHWFLERLVFFFSFDRYIAVSEHSRKSLDKIRIQKNKVVVVNNGIDTFYPIEFSKQSLREEFNLPREAAIFLYFGRLGVSKGTTTLIEAARSFLVKYPQVHFVWAVAASEDNTLQQKLEQLRQKNTSQVSVFQALSREKLVRLLFCINTVVVPSLSEGFGFSALEACSLRIPVVASDIEIFEENLWGRILFFKAGDADNLANALELALSGHFIEVKQKHDYSWQKMIDAYEAIYQDLDSSVAII